MMAQPWSEQFAARVQAWCDQVGALSADALVHAGLLAGEQFERASGILAEELFVRLCLYDYPPVPESLDGPPDA